MSELQHYLHFIDNDFRQYWKVCTFRTKASESEATTLYFEKIARRPVQQLLKMLNRAKSGGLEEGDRTADWGSGGWFEIKYEDDNGNEGFLMSLERKRTLGMARIQQMKTRGLF